MTVAGIQIAPRLVMQTKPLYDEIAKLKNEAQDLQASAAEAHLHIDALHAVIKTGDLKTAELLISDWEVSQCPF